MFKTYQECTSQTSNKAYGKTIKPLFNPKEEWVRSINSKESYQRIENVQRSISRTWNTLKIKACQY